MSTLSAAVQSILPSGMNDIPAQINSQDVTAVRLVSSTGTVLFRTAKDVQAYGKKVTDGTLVLFAKTETKTIDIGPSVIRGYAVGDTLRAMGMARSAVDSVRQQHFNGNFISVDADLRLEIWNGSEFEGISPQAAQEVHYQNVIAIIHTTSFNKSSNVVIFSPDGELAEKYSKSCRGDGSKTSMQIMNAKGDVVTVDFTSSSLSGPWVILKVIASAFMATAIGLVIGLLTALAFSWATIGLAIMLAALGVACAIGYEKGSGNPA
ncbi:MAG: hypothetical protein LBF24_01760 [Puniceicoccales bacterium]|jgi:hypothetical protein|nr:hypothetical protein [Puniceicoccales bacterium]